MNWIIDRIRHRLAQRDDAGVAMVITVSVMMLMTLIPLIVFNQSVQQLPLARHNQDHESALHAAEAGVDDYLNHLSNNGNYWTYTTTAASPDANAAFGGWVPVPGGNTNESFRYAVDTATTASTGIVYLTASGKAGNVVRTVKVGMRKLGFLDYLYLTDYEVADPAISGDSTSQCLYHAWEKNTSTGGWGPSAGSCTLIFWTTQAVLNGPTHSNDGLYVCGNPNFNGNVDTYYNSSTSLNTSATRFGGSGTWLNPNGCTNVPNFNRSGDPASGSLLAMPPANTAIQNQADPVSGPGCLYTGPTTIALKNVSGVGKMDVTSPGTKKTKTGCGPGTDLALPSNGVVYVQGVPSSSTNVNYSSCSGTNCLGDVMVSNAATNGGLAGQLTIAAANDVIITGNITYHQYPTGNDVLGLIANNDVSIYHPVSNGSNASGSTTNLRIDAAILSLNHSFYVQNWDVGSPMGNLTVNGVIAQKYRGPVGTFGGGGNTIQSGYNKDYNYDTRLKYLTPPYFMNPLQSAWVRNSFAELKPAF
jgi:Tfp pilus assembly protein PilX